MKARLFPVLLVLVQLPFAASVVRAQAPDAAAPAARLGSRVFKWEDLVAKPTSVGQRRDVADQPTATLQKFECHISTLNPGAMSHAPHRHPQEEFIVLKEGTLDVSINGQVQRVGPGSLFFFASNDLHNVTNVGDGPATYLVFNLTTAATRTAPAEGAAAAARPHTLGSTVWDWEKLKVVPTKTGERRDLFNSPTTTCKNLECHVTTLNPGERPHAPHSHGDEELVIIKEGLVEVTINGVTQQGGPGSIFFFASQDQHGMVNVGPARATYHVVRVVTEASPPPPLS